MGRIGNFFKKVWNGVKTGVKKVIQVLPKVIDVGKKVINNPDVQKLGDNIANRFNKGDQFKQATTFANDALNKASVINDTIQKLKPAVNVALKPLT